MSGDGTSCPKLSNKIILNPISIASAEIGDLPRSPYPETLSEIRESAYPGENFYLVPSTGGLCAYPLQPLGAPTFSISDFFSREVEGLPALFGKPTTLAVPPGLEFGAAIYEPWNDQAYAPDARGLRWYLVGSGERYEQFLGGILQYGQKLFQEWQESPYNMATKTWPAPEDAKDSREKTAPVSAFVAWVQMSKLKGWMKVNDPQLWAKVEPYLHYAETMPKSDCSSEITEDSYAYYTPAEDRIYLLPRSIRLLMENDYAAVAQTLAHEVSHRENAQSGLVMPSDEMLQRSFEYFHAQVDHASPAWGIAISALGQDFFHGLSCNRLPLLPEEEIDAFLRDLSYGEAQAPARQSIATHEESADAVAWLIGQVHREFPSQWGALLSDYVRLGQANHEQFK